MVFIYVSSTISWAGSYHKLPMFVGQLCKINLSRSWFGLLHKWPPNSELLLNNSLLELISFLITHLYKVPESSSINISHILFKDTTEVWHIVVPAKRNPYEWLKSFGAWLLLK